MVRMLSLVAGVVGLTSGQTATQPYLGTWTAAIANNTFVRVELTLANGAWGGRVGIGDF